MSMIDRFCSLYESKDVSTKKRELTKGEIDASIALISVYFNDAEDDLRKLLGNVVIVPLDFAGSAFFKSKEQFEEFRSFKELYSAYGEELEADFISRLLGTEFAETKKYISQVNRKIQLLKEIDPLKKLSYKRNYGEEDLKTAKEIRKEREDAWDYEEDKLNGYTSSRLEDIKEQYREADANVQILQAYIESGLDKVNVKNFCEMFLFSPNYGRELFTNAEMEEARKRMYEIDERWSNELDRLNGYGYRANSKYEASCERLERDYREAEATYLEIKNYRDGLEEKKRSRAE